MPKAKPDRDTAEELRIQLAKIEALVQSSMTMLRDMMRHESRDQATARMAGILLQHDNPQTVAVMFAVALAELESRQR